MPLFCPNCSYTPEEPDEPYCQHCGHNFISEPADATGPFPAITRPHTHRTPVAVGNYRVDCLCYNEQLEFNPYADEMSSRFFCGRYPERIDCVACPVCPKCGDLPCTCRFLGIRIKAKLPLTVDTVTLKKLLE